MAFSGAVTLTDLNDFITPSQACIKPVEVKKAPISDAKGAALTDIRVDDTGAYYEVEIGPKATGAPSQKLTKAEISLNDCLACSGCITSAESVLITMQSHEEVMSFLQSNPPPGDPDHKIPVLSISPQSLASLCSVSRAKSSSGSPSMRGVLDSVKAFASAELGFEHVFDTTFARHMALREHILEYEERSAAFKNKEEGSLPMLASACPGWICYAEKAHAEMLPFISRTKSPQQVMGTLVKEWLGRKLQKRRIYHVTVMPCYDKKLEASRQDFYNEQYRTRDVDCVLTTGELENLMSIKRWNSDHQNHSPALETFGIPDLFMPPGSSSGGWLQAIIDHIVERERLQGRTCNIRTKTIRTSDYEDVVVEAVNQFNQTEVVFRGAKCYGFRNLQNVVRKVAKEAGVKGSGSAGRATRGRVTGVTAALRARRARKGEEALTQTELGDDRPYDYVEVMACPAGCVNGGGQARRPIKAEESGDVVNLVNGDTAGMGSRWGDREWVKAVEETYWNVDQDNSLLDRMNSLAELVVTEFGPQDSTEPPDVRRHVALRTQYREVQSDVIGLNVKW
ncbi:Cytosolic Fe-S cluster assembly factor NAR1 AltName: Full=Nuclear architecture-related protein 1 [Serendipita indica DSM 11827]|nr:Cytosolic Fe-S cluster assembly factor NAR1 AltName: Full=Nuclear architecture-related protein 1 [Serendipita indica DSM 11827]